jgi:hypothetical protein
MDHAIPGFGAYPVILTAGLDAIINIPHASVASDCADGCCQHRAYTGGNGPAEDQPVCLERSPRDFRTPQTGQRSH